MRSFCFWIHSVLFVVMLFSCDKKISVKDRCGDDFVDPGEECDGRNLDGKTCALLGYYRVEGVLSCTPQCQFDTSDCGVARCGDGSVQENHNEQCDGTELNGQSCLSLGYERGTLACTAACRFDISDCVGSGACGDGIIQHPEECDGNQLNGQTCQSLGFYVGTLVCGSNCQFDFTSCSGRCGDGLIDDQHQEECDTLNLGGRNCEGFGFYGGQLACSSTCRFDLGPCEAVGRCGDGIIQLLHGEVCDGDELGGVTCISQGWHRGQLACMEDCQGYDETDCAIAGRCGDGIIQEEWEECEGADLGGQTCVTLGYSPRSGDLGCTVNCQYNRTLCAEKSSNANLSTLTVGTGTLVPSFSPGVVSYDVNVPMSVGILTVAATAQDSYATVAVSPAQPMNLAEGINLVVITVTAENGLEKAYNVAITRRDYQSPNIGMLKYVPAGQFQRDSEPENISGVSAFRMGVHEITRSQFAVVTGWPDPANPAYSSGTNDPVQRVSWYDAIAFCNKLSLLEGLTPVYAVEGVDFAALAGTEVPVDSDETWNAVTVDWEATGYRLPTQMEWMWAAMGADTANPGAVNTTGWSKPFAGSGGTNVIGDYAVFGFGTTEDGRTLTERTNPVGSKLPNELGLYDMSGNIWEWVWDWFATGYPSGYRMDYRGPAPGSYRVKRGGHWGNPSMSCSIEHRWNFFPEQRSRMVGFRVVRR